MHHAGMRRAALDLSVQLSQWLYTVLRLLCSSLFSTHCGQLRSRKSVWEPRTWQLETAMSAFVALPLGLYDPRVEGVPLEYGVCCGPTTDAHPDIQLRLSPDLFRVAPSEAKREAKSMASTDIAAPNSE